MIITLFSLLFFALTSVSFAAAVSDDILAEIDGEPITAEQVEESIGSQISKLQEQIYNLKREKIEAIVAEKLLAKEAVRRGITVTALLDKEVTSKVGLVTEQEVDEFYKKNKTQMRGEEAKLRQQIRSYLQNQKLNARRQEFLESLVAKSKVVVHLQPPPVFRAEVSADGAPYKGGAKAAVTIVKFEDFQCPFCKQVQPTFEKLLARYRDKIKLAHRDFPIDSLHPQARLAHEAARCANEQGKFWAYHDKVYANSSKVGVEDLKSYAKEVGLDQTKFDQCVDAGKFKSAVQKDVEEGTRLGVTGTPAFFINGRLISGAQSLENFARVIDDELARVEAKK
jgi:protein-disulfide isomerase